MRDSRATRKFVPNPIPEKHLFKFYPGDGSPIVASVASRNAKCQCGSGKKQKHCCGCVTKYFTTKSK